MERKFGIVAECLGKIPQKVEQYKKYYDYESLTDEEYLKKAYDSLKRISLL